MAPAPAELPVYVEPAILLGSLLAVVGTALLFVRAGARTRTVALALGAWLAVDLGLAWSGFYEGYLVGRVPRVLLGIVASMTIVVAAIASRRVRQLATRMDPRWLVGLQTFRVVGAVFLAALAAGVLPRVFAGPAGWGDVLVGLAAPVVALVALRGRGGWWAVAVWNTLGLADLVMAVTLGNLAGPHTGNVLQAVPTTEALTMYPLVLIPTFAVPLALLLHLLTYVRLGRVPTSLREARSG